MKELVGSWGQDTWPSMRCFRSTKPHWLPTMQQGFVFWCFKYLPAKFKDTSSSYLCLEYVLEKLMSRLHSICADLEGRVL